MGAKMGSWMLDGGMGSVGRGLNTLDRARSAWAAREVVLARVVMLEENRRRSMDRFVRWCESWSEWGARARVLDASEASVIGDDDEWTKRKCKGANN